MTPGRAAATLFHMADEVDAAGNAPEAVVDSDYAPAMRAAAVVLARCVDWHRFTVDDLRAIHSALCWAHPGKRQPGACRRMANEVNAEIQRRGA